jgi:hypothetical protein
VYFIPLSSDVEDIWVGITGKGAKVMSNRVLHTREKCIVGAIFVIFSLLVTLNYNFHTQDKTWLHVYVFAFVFVFVCHILMNVYILIKL